MRGRCSIWCLLVVSSLTGLHGLLAAEGDAAPPQANQTPPAGQTPLAAPPIAFVDLDVVLESPRWKQRIKEAQEAPVPLRSVTPEPDYARLVTSVEALEQQLLAPELEPEKRPVLLARYIQTNRALRSRIEVEKLRPSLQHAFKNELAAVIKQVAVQNKFSVVLYRTKNERPPNEETQNMLRNPVVYTDPALDITPLVIERLEKGGQSEKGGHPK
jgi:hypothetical protein